MATVKKIRRKLNIKGLIFLLLTFYLIGILLYAFFTMPIKNIYIKNTKILTDNEIIEIAGIKDYPALFSINNKKLEQKIKSLELVSNVKVKKELNGKLIIEIEEAIPLFYNRSTNKVVLSNHLEVDASYKYSGIPTLINYVTNDILKSFIDAFQNIDQDIISMINEIEYDPDISEDIVIDNERFLLRMNDTNHVYVNIINMKKLNDYKQIYASLPSHGTILLDSYSKENDVVGIFSAFDNKTNSNDNNNNNNTGDSGRNEN